MTMPPRQTRQLSRSRHPSAFSFMEMLVATACLGILLGASVQVTNNALRREESLAVVLAVAGWLEEVQRNAIRLNEQCTVTFDTIHNAWTPKNPGDPIATVSPTKCAVDPILLLPRTGFSQSANTPDRKPFEIKIIHRVGSGNGPELVFTRHGSVPLTKHYIFAVQSLIDKSKHTRRCVRITQVVGTIGVGKIRTTDPENNCIPRTYDETL